MSKNTNYIDNINMQLFFCQFLFLSLDYHNGNEYHTKDGNSLWSISSEMSLRRRSLCALVQDYSEKFFFVRNELDTKLKQNTHTSFMEVSCADLRMGLVPKALTIRQRRKGLFYCLLRQEIFGMK